MTAPESDEIPPSSRPVRLSGWLLTLTLLAFCFLHGPPRGDFANYVTAGSIWLHAPGELPSLIDYHWFTAQSEAAGFGDQLVGWPVLSPPSILQGVPLAVFEPATSAWLWVVGQALCALAVAVVISRSVRRPLAVGAIALLAAAPALSSHLDQGQFHLPAVLALAVGLHAFRSGREVTAGVAFALAAGLKIHAWPVLVVVALAGRWRMATAGLGTLLIGGLISVALLGWPVHAVWLGEIAPAASRGAMMHPWAAGFGSWGAIVRHLLLPHPGLNPTGPLDLPALAWGLPVAAQWLAIGLTCAIAPRWRRLTDTQRHGLLAASATVALLLGAALFRYHLLLVVPAVVFAIDAQLRAGRRAHAAFLGTLALVLWFSPSVGAWSGPSSVLWASLRPTSATLLWVALVPWRALHPIGAAAATALALALGLRAVPQLALDVDGAETVDAPTAPLIAGGLTATEDGALWFSGLPTSRFDHPGDGWLGYRLAPGDASPIPVHSRVGTHVTAPRPIGADAVTWNEGTTHPSTLGPRVGPDGSTLEVREGDIWLVPSQGLPRQLTTHPGHDTEPAWDRTTGRIWFLSDRGVGVRALRLWFVEAPRRE